MDIAFYLSTAMRATRGMGRRNTQRPWHQRCRLVAATRRNGLL